MKQRDFGVHEPYIIMRQNNMKYWVSHFAGTKLFHIVFYFLLDVLPPDEHAKPCKNNSVYTNAIASLSIQLANYVSCITNKTVPQEWLNIASNLYFPFDNWTQTYLEYEGFDLSKYSASQKILPPFLFLSFLSLIVFYLLFFYI